MTQKIKFTDKNNYKYELWLRGSYGHIKSQKQLKDILDRACSVEGIKKLYPSYPLEAAIKLSESYKRSTYMRILDQFGMVSKSILIDYPNKRETKE